MQPSTALAITQEPQAPALYFGETLSVMAEVMVANMGPSNLFGYKDIQKVKFPGAGSLAWTLAGVDGKETTSVIEGVILAWQEHRGYYQEQYGGGNEAPDCFAEQPLDGQVQIGSVARMNRNGVNFGGACATCPVGMWQLDDGKKTRPLCRPRVRVYLQTRESALPIWIDLPSTSVPVFREYMKALTRFGFAHYWVVTRLSLEMAESKGVGKNGKPMKIDYPVLVLKARRVEGNDKQVYTFSTQERVALAPWRATILKLIDPANRAAARARDAETVPETAAAAYEMDEEDTTSHASADDAPEITEDL